MKRFLVAFILSMLAGLAVPAGASAAGSHTSTWHRLNPDQSNPAPNTSGSAAGRRPSGCAGTTRCPNRS
jgi:hypothetical protein